MKILITGASGGLGQRLVPALLARDGVNIRTLVRLNEKSPNPNQKTLNVVSKLPPRRVVNRSPVEFPQCEAVKGALENPDSLIPATDGIDTVLHLAALTHSPNEEDYFKVNAEGTKNLIEACRRNKIRRFIFMSSGAAHPEGGAYSESKLAAEEFVKQSGLSWVILRPREVYGTGGREGINQLISWVQKYPVIPVIGDGGYSLSPVYIDDVVFATVESVFRTDVADRTFDMAGPEELTFTALIDRLAGFLGVRVGKIFVPLRLVYGMTWLLNGLNIKFMVRDQIPRLLCDKSSPENPEIPLLNFHPRKLEEGLRECFSRKD